MHVLGVGGGGGDDVLIVTRQRYDQRGGGFGQAMTEACILGHENLRHPVDLGGGFAGGSGRGAGGQ